MALLDATERKVLVISTFLSGVILLFPMEWVSGVALLVLSAIFYVVDQRITRREEASQPATQPAETVFYPVAEGGAGQAAASAEGEATAAPGAG